MQGGKLIRRKNMNISTNYDYYKQSYLLSSLSNKSVSVGSNTTSGLTETNSISSTGSRKTATSDDWSVLNYSLSANRIKKSLETQNEESSEKFMLMESIRADMDAIKELSIDEMSADEIKEVLANLQNDLKLLPSPDGKGHNIIDADLDTMSEEDMRALLTEVQEEVNAMGNNRPPKGELPPMDFGLELSKLLESDTEEEVEVSELIKALTEKYNISTSSEDYLSELKESLNAVISDQKTKLDSLGDILLERFEKWNTEQQS